jgi:aminoglycoside phosphotransferase (APT) family kinase protein
MRTRAKMTHTPADTRPVAPQHAIDAGRLGAWLAANVAPLDGPLEIAQFKGGQSNPTYLLAAGRQRYVLRRKPPGKLLPSAHAVDREFRVIRALPGCRWRRRTRCARTRR